MSLQVPLIGVTSRYVSRLSNLPSSNDSKKLLDTDNVEGVLNLIQNSFNLSDISLDTVITKLNHHYQNQINEIFLNFF